MKTITKRIMAVLLCLLLATLALAGCQKDDGGLKGRYCFVDTDGTVYKDQYIEFSPDGNDDTLVMKNREGKGPLLHYSISEGEIILTQSSFSGTDEERYPFSYAGNTIYLSGMKFVKQ